MLCLFGFLVAYQFLLDMDIKKIICYYLKDVACILSLCFLEYRAKAIKIDHIWREYYFWQSYYYFKN